MKRWIVWIWMVLLLSGCTKAENAMDRALALRSGVQANGCSFRAKITADYGETIFTFTLLCCADGQGNVGFSVLEPESISGITGKIDSGTGNLTFDDVVLSFALLADGQLTPVSMPWVVVNALRSGYIVSAGKEGDHTRLTVKDTYAADALRVDLWLDDADSPVQAEVAWQDRRILTMEIQNFTLA